VSAQLIYLDYTDKPANQRMLSHGVVGVTCIDAFKLLDGYTLPEYDYLMLDPGLVCRSIEVYANGGLNIYVGMPGAERAAAFIRVRPE
jgi:hypothetical protein